MGLESTNYIAGLVTTNPGASDPKSQGDDHLRLLKGVLRQAFPGYTGTVSVGGTDVGAVNAYVLTPATPLLAYGANMEVLWVPAATSTSTSPTMNISGLGAVPIRRADGTAPAAGEIVAGQPLAMIYNGSEFRMVGVTMAYVLALAFAAALPAQSLGFLVSNGASAAFGQTHTGYAQKEVRGADIASAATINLTTATGNYCHLTGTTPVSAITIPSGACYDLYVEGVVTFTHSAALDLPGKVNYTTAAGDRLRIRGDTSGAVVMNITPAGGYPIAPYPYMKVSDRKASGTSGGNSTPTTISQTRTLNTIESNTIVGASLASDTITLPPGTYKVSGTAQTFNTNANKAFFYNATDGTYAIVGISSFSGSNAASDALLEGYFTITSTKNFTVRHYTVTNGGAANSLGVSTSSGQVEVYSQVVIEKVG